MDAVVEWQSCAIPNCESAAGELAEAKRRPHIDDLIAIIRANDSNVFSHARARAIDPLTLRSQLLLHLPRLVTADYFPDARDIKREVQVASDYLEDIQRPYAEWLKPPEKPIALDDLEFVSLDEDIAKVYHERLHYIGSYRPGRHFAFQDRNSGRIVCIGSIACFDLRHAEEMIAQDVDPRSAFMLSRFFAFRWAPEKTFSYFYGKLRLKLIAEFDAKLMFSFVNPNLGFNAGSYRSANWILFARETATRYMYLEGRYRTMRFFVSKYGTSNSEQLSKKLGHSFQVSTVNLQPMLILAIPLQRRARKAIPPKPYLFERPVL